MKTKILEHVRNVCELKNSDDIYGLFDLPVHLEHLLFAIDNEIIKGGNNNVHFSIKSDGEIKFIDCFAEIHRNYGYDLQKTVEQNLEDEALCKLLVEVLNIK